MSIQLPELEFANDSLEPFMSKQTLEYHYGKHHKAYVDKVNELIKGGPFQNSTLEEIVQKSDGPLFNNAAQVSNHNFFWRCLTPKREPEVSDDLKNKLIEDFESVEKFKDNFSKTAKEGFGSGWTWLELDQHQKLVIRWRPNAETPLKNHDATPLLVCDVWEHAYYLDTQNNREKYLENFWNIVNWKFVSQCFTSSQLEYRKAI